MLGGGRGPCLKLQHQQQQQQPLRAAHPRRRCVRCRSQQASQSAQQLLSRMMDHHLQDSAAAARPSSCTSTAALLDHIYDNIDEVFYSNGGFKIPRREKQSIDATGGSSSYGEVEAAGVDVLLRHLAMDSSSTFVDLGCGRGRAVLQVALHAPVARAIGLELSHSRLEQAEMALQQLREKQTAGQRLAPVEFRSADLSSCSLDEGTHFYLCSTAFGAAICRSIAERLHASPSFQALVTSRQLPSQPHLIKLGEVPCEYTFNSNGRAYIYVKSLSPAVAAVCSRLWCRDGACWLPSLSLQQLGLTADEPVNAAAGRRFVQLSGTKQQPETAAAGSGSVSSSDGGVQDSGSRQQ